MPFCFYLIARQAETKLGTAELVNRCAVGAEVKVEISRLGKARLSREEKYSVRSILYSGLRRPRVRQYRLGTRAQRGYWSLQ